MSLRVTDRTTVALYDSTTGFAFGPVFDSEEDAYAFLEWVEPKTFIDVRLIPRNELDGLKEAWAMEHDGRFGVGA